MFSWVKPPKSRIWLIFSHRFSISSFSIDSNEDCFFIGFRLGFPKLRRVWDKLGRWRRSERCGCLEQGGSGVRTSKHQTYGGFLNYRATPVIHSRDFPWNQPSSNKGYRHLWKAPYDYFAWDNMFETSYSWCSNAQTLFLTLIDD